MRLVVFVVVASLMVGCGAPSLEIPDSGEIGVDAGLQQDAGAIDAGIVADAGSVLPDAGVDAGQPVSGIPVLGNGKHVLNAVEYTLVANAADGLNVPRDVAINPASPNDVWIANYADSSMVIVKGRGTAQETKSKKNGVGNVHFMPRPSALAFGATNRMATAHEEDRITQPSTPFDFMGPSLWPTDASFEGGHASHMDMLHNSPNAVGIAWDRANVYWVFDGYHNAITRYDFANDHGPGGDDHTDGIINRCVQGQVSYVKGLSSGIELDQTSKLLYIADSGNRRVAVLNTMTVVTAGTALNPNYDGATQQLMSGMTLSTLVNDTTSPLRRPSGLALRGGLVYVSDNETSKIYAFDLTGKLIDYLDLSPIVQTGGLQGLDFDATGALYAVDSLGTRVIRISPKI